MVNLNLPAEQVTLTPLQIGNLIEAYRNIRHAVRNHLMVIGGHASICRFREDAAERDRSLKAIEQQGHHIDHELLVFAELLKRTVGIHDAEPEPPHPEQSLEAVHEAR